MTKSDEQMDPRNLITERLKRAEWSRDPAAEGLDWPEFSFNNGKIDLEFLYFPPRGWIRLGLLTEQEEGYLQIHCGQNIDHFLEILVTTQNELDADSWDSFINTLLRFRFRVYAITGEGEDDLVELTPGE
ncbi:hypothetical protein ACIQPT_06470 [Streptomyces sp. NPDC091289]|uniref:hypothetical protein n=1 Tax=Streptomyces sp. NPDC091289 TaxID=3365989 RepID=UPI00382E82E4